MTKSKIFLFFYLSFIGGIFLSSIIIIPKTPLLLSLILGIFSIVVFWRGKNLAIFGFSLLFLIFGMWRYQITFSKIISLIYGLQILSWLLWLFLDYILKIIDFFSKVSLTSLNLEHFSWIFLLISYLILGIITLKMQEIQKLKFLNY